MTTYTVDEKDLKVLSGKTILIIGAATGIGNAAVKIALDHGANVAVGDWNEAAADLLVNDQERTLFKKCDVSKWDDVLDLFLATQARFGTIHSVLSNAGINTHEGLLDETHDSSGRLLPPSLKSVDVNLIGQLYVTRCALSFFRQQGTKGQLVLTASAGAFFAAPPIHMYCAAKAGVLGLMRAVHPDAEKIGCTVNVVAPWLTVTPMLIPDWLDKWTLPKNSAEGVARALFLPVLRPELNGKSFFVSGDRYIELEDSLYETQPQWMGEELCGHVRKGQDILLGKER